MKHWKHLNCEQRRIIKHFLSKNAKLKEIASALCKDEAAIRKEIIRNRTEVQSGLIGIDPSCPKKERFPYVCDGCPKKYKGCGKPKYEYDADKAQLKANSRLIGSRSGFDMDEEEFLTLDKLVVQGLKEKKSPYIIKTENPVISKSVSSIYRYIHKGIMTSKPIDLVYAVKYKKRFKSNKKYDYSNNQIDRSSRTFLDYLQWRFKNPGALVCQMDFPGSAANDSNDILTLSFTDIHFVLLILIKRTNSAKIIKVFNDLEETLGIETFQKLFGCILTDRDPVFTDFTGIESNKDKTGEFRTHIFYCDAYRSTQKANVENMNRQIRKYIPKGSSMDNLTVNDVKAIQRNLNERPIASLGGKSPKDVFISLFGIDNYKKLK